MTIFPTLLAIGHFQTLNGARDGPKKSRIASRCLACVQAVTKRAAQRKEPMAGVFGVLVTQQHTFGGARSV